MPLLHTYMYILNKRYTYVYQPCGRKIKYVKYIKFKYAARCVLIFEADSDRVMKYYGMSRFR